ncbi:carcinoembryonic antigen-related cell adhesion molecule 1-like isoform X2 [Synchiropus splendidus]|uniref:carcinoembryonic antigen-related cell adhesion molecule 1-like isoform X2 n=1 Tax=Synchiropus splendidus TaxID=270530 RepID=UPI00237D39E9|nr:carcinoembryonic antigen-related cell adhesion molecule 1-like isoform X2 [Synchiropus splendidus]
MDLLTIIGIVLVASKAGVLAAGSQDAAVGETVTFRVTLSPTQTPFTIDWRFTRGTDVVSSIISSLPTINKTNPEYEDRITLFRSTGSLELRNVSTNDSGTYRANILTTEGESIEDSTDLQVHVLITGAKLTVSPEDLVEFNSSVTFNCSVASGSSLAFRWRNISSEISASDEVLITDGGAKLTILNVTRYDQGPYRCGVSNAVSKDISDPVTLSISYGPDEVDLQVSPSQEHFEEGSTIRLSCSSSSSPPAQLQWLVNDTLLPNTGPELLLTDATEAQSGGYSCQAYNNKTLRYRTSPSKAVTVLVKISAASLTASTNLLIEGMSVNLSCDAAGSIYSRLWWKDGIALNPDDNMMLVDGNRTLSLKSVRRSDDGVYSCTQSNPLQNIRMNYAMVVNFGPEQVTITGPDQVEVQSPFTLTCTAESTPAANFTWKHNGIMKGSSSVFTVKKAQLSNNGTYVCEAQNNVAGKTLTKTHELFVRESPCPPGCIAGIVVGCLVVIVAAAVGGFFLYRRRTKQKKITSRRGTEGENNLSFADSQDLNYAEVSFYHKANGDSVQLGSSDQSTDYAEVKVKTPSSPPSYDAHLKRVKNRAPRPGLNYS